MAGQPDALVLGGGPAGLLAAAALDRRGLAVVIVDQDDPPVANSPRPGVPHGAQLHNLLGRAQQHFDELLPGYVDALIEAGGAQANVASHTHVYELGIRMPERSLDLRLLSAPRALIESVARALVPRRVTQRWATRVLGLRMSGDTVIGAETSAGPIEAALVVDALGANSPVSRWSGEQPEETTFAARQWYCSTVFRRPEHQFGSPDFWLTFPSTTGTRSGLISPLGDDRWSVSMSGVTADRPPRDAQRFCEFAGTLEDDRISEALAGAAPLTAPRTFGRPVARWRRFDCLRRRPTGLVHLGDAVAALNPLLGQGLSVAAWQASVLGELAADGLDAVYAGFAAGSAASVADAWTLTRIHESDLTDEDWHRVARLVTADVAAHREYVRMWHMLESPMTATKLARSGICT